MKTIKYSTLVVISTIFGIMGMITGWILLIGWIIGVTEGKWWQPVAGAISTIIFMFFLEVIPKIPTKEERLDILEEKVDSLFNK